MPDHTGTDPVQRSSQKFRWPWRRGPPLTIPNREVKPVCADGTATPGGRVGRRLLRGSRSFIWSGSFFFVSLWEGHWFFAHGKGQVRERHKSMAFGLVIDRTPHFLKHLTYLLVFLFVPLNPFILILKSVLDLT